MVSEKNGQTPERETGRGLIRFNLPLWFLLAQRSNRQISKPNQQQALILPHKRNSSNLGFWTSHETLNANRQAAFIEVEREIDLNFWTEVSILKRREENCARFSKCFTKFRGWAQWRANYWLCTLSFHAHSRCTKIIRPALWVCRRTPLKFKHKHSWTDVNSMYGDQIRASFRPNVNPLKSFGGTKH